MKPGWRKFVRRTAVILTVMVSVSSQATANNTSISNQIYGEQDKTNDTVKVQFDLSWNNSWRDGTNRDAVWVFVKYSTDSGGSWKHAKMSLSGTNPSGFVRGSGTTLDLVVPSDKNGVMIERSGSGTGSVSTTGIKLVWDYSATGLTDADLQDQVLIKVIGIEMVQIPSQSFYAGDATNSSSNPPSGFYDAGSGTHEAFAIVGESALTLGGTSSGNLATRTGGSAVTDDFSSGTTKTLSAAFPKGYGGFYVMKHELSQGLWTTFLNTLSRTEQQRRTATDVSTASITNVYVMLNASSSSNRQMVVAPSSGNGTTDPIEFSTTRQHRGMNYLNWADMAAFADWAAMRPMTELEYERVARGFDAPATGEYAWGNTTITACTTLSGTEDGTERCSTSNANAVYNSNTFTGGDGSTGPARAGIFATSTSDREAAGASYYGALEMSGNVWETVVTLGDTIGRSFQGTHGDGVLTTASGYEANATNTDWPGLSSTTVRGISGETLNGGVGLRGGSWATTHYRLRTSDRDQAGDYATAHSRNSGNGFRAVREVEV